MRRFVIAAVLVLVATGCSSSDGSTGPVPTAAQTTSSPAATGSVQVSSDGTPSDDCAEVMNALSASGLVDLVAQAEPVFSELYTAGQAFLEEVENLRLEPSDLATVLELEKEKIAGLNVAQQLDPENPTDEQLAAVNNSMIELMASTDALTATCGQGR